MLSRLLAFIAVILISTSAGAVWVAGTDTDTVPVTTQSPFTQDFQVAGPLTGITTSMCRSPILLSFDASIGDASNDARIRWFSCDDWQDTPPSGTCREIPIQSQATGETLNQYTDFQLQNPQAAIVPLAQTATVGGDTARATLKCTTLADSSTGPGAGFAGVDAFWAAECAAPPLTEAEALECVAAKKATTSELTVVTQTDSPPVGLCANPNGGQCLHIDTDAGGTVVEGFYLAVDGGAFVASGAGEPEVFRTSTYAPGSSTGGLQEALNACEKGVNGDECRVLIDVDVTLTTTVTIGDIQAPGDTTYATMVECRSTSPSMGDNYLAGVNIIWNGPAGGTMFNVLGTYGTKFTNCGILVDDAGEVFHVQGNSVGARPSHVFTADNVNIRGDWSDTALAYHFTGTDTDGAEFTGTTAAGSTTTSVEVTGGGLGDWTTDCTSENDEACWIIFGDVHGVRYELRHITANDADTISWSATEPLAMAPTAGTPFTIQSLGAADGPCDLGCADDVYEDQVDYGIIRGGGAQGVGACVQIDTTQAIHMQALDGFECAGYNSPQGGFFVQGGQFLLSDGYCGTSTAGAGPCVHIYGPNTAGAIFPADYKIEGMAFEMDAATADAIVSENHNTTDIYYTGTIIGNKINILEEGPDPIKITKMGSTAVIGNTFLCQGGAYDADIIFENDSVATAQHTWASNILTGCNFSYSPDAQAFLTAQPFGMLGSVGNEETLHALGRGGIDDFQRLDYGMLRTKVFVDPYVGSDSNPGTENLPLRSLAAAKTAAAEYTAVYCKADAWWGQLTLVMNAAEKPSFIPGEPISWAAPGAGTGIVRDWYAPTGLLVVRTLTGVDPDATSVITGSQAAAKNVDSVVDTIGDASGIPFTMDANADHDGHVVGLFASTVPRHPCNFECNGTTCGTTAPLAVFNVGNRTSGWFAQRDTVVWDADIDAYAQVNDGHSVCLRCDAYNVTPSGNSAWTSVNADGISVVLGSVGTNTTDGITGATISAGDSESTNAMIMVGVDAYKIESTSATNHVATLSGGHLFIADSFLRANTATTTANTGLNVSNSGGDASVTLLRTVLQGTAYSSLYATANGSDANTLTISGMYNTLGGQTGPLNTEAMRIEVSDVDANLNFFIDMRALLMGELASPIQFLVLPGAGGDVNDADNAQVTLHGMYDDNDSAGNFVYWFGTTYADYGAAAAVIAPLAGWDFFESDSLNANGGTPQILATGARCDPTKTCWQGSSEMGTYTIPGGGIPAFVLGLPVTAIRVGGVGSSYGAR